MITILPYYHIHPFIVSTVGAVDTGQQPGWCRVVTGAAATGSTQQSCQRHVSSEPTPDPTTPQQQQPLPQHRPGWCGSLLTVQASASVSPFPVCSDYFWCGYSGTFGGHQTRFFPPASRCGLGGKVSWRDLTDIQLSDLKTIPNHEHTAQGKLLKNILFGLVCLRVWPHAIVWL